MPHTLSQKREIYARLRAELEQLLGPHCALCGSEDTWAVDHEGGTRVYSSRRVNSITRLKWYLEDAKKGLVRRLCNSCNGTDGDTRRFYTESVIDDTIST